MEINGYCEAKSDILQEILECAGVGEAEREDIRKINASKEPEGARDDPVEAIQEKSL